MRGYYQKMLLKMVRDLKLLDDEGIRKTRFDIINEDLEVHKY